MQQLIINANLFRDREYKNRMINEITAIFTKISNNENKLISYADSYQRIYNLILYNGTEGYSILHNILKKFSKKLNQEQLRMFHDLCLYPLHKGSGVDEWFEIEEDYIKYKTELDKMENLLLSIFYSVFPNEIIVQISLLSVNPPTIPVSHTIMSIH